MERRIMKQGPSTLVVSLPSAWVKKHNIHKGDRVHLEERGKTLSIFLTPKQSEKRISLDLSGTLPMTNRITGALYKAGFDEIKLSYGKSEEAEAIMEAVKAMTGHEVIKHEKNVIMIKRLVLSDVESFSTLYRKCFHVLHDMAHDTLQALEKNDKELMRAVVIKDQTMAVFVDYTRRIVLAGDAPEHAQQLYHIAEQLERIADRFKYICQEYEAVPYKPSDNALTILRQVIHFISQFEGFFYDFSLEKTVEFGRERERIQKAIDNSRLTEKDARLLFYCTSIFTSLFDLNGAVMTMRLD